jgi:hypothetical protein
MEFTVAESDLVGFLDPVSAPMSQLFHVHLIADISNTTTAWRHVLLLYGMVEVIIMYRADCTIPRDHKSSLGRFPSNAVACVLGL